MSAFDVSTILRSVSAMQEKPPRLWWSTDEASQMRSRLLRDNRYAESVEVHAESVIRDPDVFAREPAWHVSQCEPLLSLAYAAWLFQRERYASLASRLMDRAASAESWDAPEEFSPKPVAVALTLAKAIDLLAAFTTDDQLERYDIAAREKCFARLPGILKSRGMTDQERMVWCSDSACAALGTLSPSGLLIQEVARAASCLMAALEKKSDVRALPVVRIGRALSRRSDDVARLMRDQGLNLAIPEPNPFAVFDCEVLALLELPVACIPSAA
ncbi:MAG TPA: hypothetical protein PK251_09970 [Candidatus Latescibacteria bacterium]|nr:hypothetical protein [Candidatus Latescibacterota bacterium]HOS65065.1 hypothetical protein [Candidatus Latescibacterota bacterium]HPK75978.1 hypothetical protein [Candidatus Latescibacterota bacterium]